MDEGDVKFIRKKVSGMENYEAKQSYHQARKAWHSWKRLNRMEPRRQIAEFAGEEEAEKETAKNKKLKNKERVARQQRAKAAAKQIFSKPKTKTALEEIGLDRDIKLDVKNPLEEPISQHNEDLAFGGDVITKGTLEEDENRKEKYTE